MGKQSVREQRPKWNREKKTETENPNSLRDAGIQPTGLQQVHFAGLASHVHMECTKPFFFFITRFTCHHSNAHFWIYIWETTPSATIVRWFEVLHMCRLPRFVWLLFSLDGFSIFSLSNYRNRAFRFLFFFTWRLHVKINTISMETSTQDDVDDHTFVCSCCCWLFRFNRPKP